MIHCARLIELVPCGKLNQLVPCARIIKLVACVCVAQLQYGFQTGLEDALAKYGNDTTKTDAVNGIQSGVSTALVQHTLTRGRHRRYGDCLDLLLGLRVVFCVLFD